jgi:hypothetical protein
MNRELDDIRNLIAQAEHTIEFLSNLVPPNEHVWLNWRLDKLQRKIRTAKHEMGKLINDIQAQALHMHDAKRIQENSVVENLVAQPQKTQNR